MKNSSLHNSDEIEFFDYTSNSSFSALFSSPTERNSTLNLAVNFMHSANELRAGTISIKSTNLSLMFEPNKNERAHLYDNSLHEWLILSLSLFAIVGFLGNLLVCLAIKIDPKLQNATNYYLFSLALTDLLISVVVIPLAIVRSSQSKPERKSFASRFRTHFQLESKL